MDAKVLEKELLTPKDAIAAVIFLRDEVKKGKLNLVPLLRKKLMEIGLYKESAFRKLLDEGRKAFLLRTKAADEEFLHDIHALGDVETHNVDFRSKVQAYLHDVTEARTEAQTFARIDRLKAFLAEFDFMSDEMLKHALGAALWEKYKSREKSEPIDETEEQEAS